MDAESTQPTGVHEGAPIVRHRRGPRALSNLLWLLPPTPRRHVLLVHDGNSPFSGVLDEYFEVCETALLAPGTDLAQCRRAPGQPDLVVIDVDALRTQGQPTLPEFVQSLKAEPTGEAPPIVLCFKARGRRFTTSALARLTRDIAPCALRVECAYYAAPSLARPIELVPVDKGAVRTFDALASRSWLRRVVRTLLIHTGLHDLLFEDLIAVAAS